MQRTVHATKIFYAETALENGQLTARLEDVTVPTTDPKKATKMATDVVGHSFQAVATKEQTILYSLPDEIFFKYAKVAKVWEDGELIYEAETAEVDEEETAEVAEA